MIENLISLKEFFGAIIAKGGSSSPILVFYMGKTLLYRGKTWKRKSKKKNSDV